MRSDSEWKCWVVILAGALSLAALGCGSKTPPTSAFPPPASVSGRAMVCDFESNTPTAVNPGLFDRGNPPTYGLLNPGEVSYWGSSTVSVSFAGPVTGGAAGTAHSYQCAGSLIDPGNGEYPSIDVQARFRNSGAVYDMGAFTGIKFTLKVGSGDTALERVFEIPLASTVPVTAGGTCLANCYDHFRMEYANTGGVWVEAVHAFADFTRQGYGGPLDPPGLYGSNLGKAIGLQWREGNANAPATIAFDLSVDEISFY